MRLLLAVAFCFSLFLLTGCGGENNRTDPTKSKPAVGTGSGNNRKIQEPGAPSLD